MDDQEYRNWQQRNLASSFDYSSQATWTEEVKANVCEKIIGAVSLPSVQLEDSTDDLIGQLKGLPVVGVCMVIGFFFRAWNAQGAHSGRCCALSRFGGAVAFTSISCEGNVRKWNASPRAGRSLSSIFGVF
jgi:hypothetical protein